MSNSTITPTNMELTPCRVTFNGVDLGGTLKTVKITGTYKKADIKADQLGETVIDRRVSAMEFKVETVLAEIKNKDIWKVAFPNAREISAGNKAMYFESAIGQTDVSLAKVLLLHPLSIADATKDFDHTFYLAVAESISEVVFGPTEQQGLKVIWNILPDTGTIPARFWFHGDTTNGIVAATAGTPAFTGTGNGTLTAVTVYNGVSKTETITATAVGIPSGNKSEWYISGSVSGAIGLLELTSSSAGGSANFTSTLIAFTITDGTTDFVKGDAFTIAVTASNYA